VVAGGSVNPQVDSIKRTCGRQGVAGGSGRQQKRATISEESEDENRKGTGMSPYNSDEFTCHQPIANPHTRAVGTCFSGVQNSVPQVLPQRNLWQNPHSSLLVSASGYTSPKTIVVKFRRGLDTKLGDAIATLAAGRPDDLDSEGWFKAAVRINQARATNTAFQASAQPAPTVSEIISMKQLPTPVEVAEEVLTTPEPPLQSPNVLNIKDMSVDNI